MIIVRLVGGLGNQLFAYAAGRAVAVRNSAVLKLDISGYGGDPLRAYRLDSYRIAAGIATRDEVRSLIGGGLKSVRTRLFLRLQRFLPPSKQRIILERRGGGYDARLAELGGTAYLGGYWQSAKYFEAISDLVRQELALARPLSPSRAELLVQIEGELSVSVHVRRGDYLTNPLYGGICVPEYYERAVSRIAEMVGPPHLYVFSDDIAWVEQNLHLGYPATYVGGGGPERDAEDLYLMSRCKGHIIANSSFSWWGAWLNDRTDKVVIAPARWFNDPSRDTRDLLPPTWLRL